MSRFARARPKKGGDSIVSKAQQRATKKYQDRVYKVYRFRIRKDTEKELIQKLESEPSINAYIKNLIKKDIEN